MLAGPTVQAGLQESMWLSCKMRKEIDMRKKAISLFALIMILFTLGACSQPASTELTTEPTQAPVEQTEAPKPASKYVPGTYTGKGNGLYGTIVVEVKLGADVIESVTVVSHDETEGYGTPAIEKLPKIIQDTQSTDVDIISGATFASKGVIDAVNDAISQGSNS